MKGRGTREWLGGKGGSEIKENWTLRERGCGEEKREKGLGKEYGRGKGKEKE